MSGKGFPKKEHLTGKDHFNELFANGNRLHLPPLQFIWKSVPMEPGAPVRTAVAVSSRKVKKASDRNLIKRRVRESYRVHKAFLVEECLAKQTGLHLVVLYISGKKASYQELNELTYKGLCKVLKSI
jgi:ribonuclease P protein component